MTTSASFEKNCLNEYFSSKEQEDDGAAVSVSKSKDAVQLQGGHP